MSSEYLGWMMFVVAVLSVSLHLKHRVNLGLSNDLREATEGNTGGGKPQPDESSQLANS